MLLLTKASHKVSQLPHSGSHTLRTTVKHRRIPSARVLRGNLPHDITCGLTPPEQFRSRHLNRSRADTRLSYSPSGASLYSYSRHTTIRPRARRPLMAPSAVVSSPLEAIAPLPSWGIDVAAFLITLFGAKLVIFCLEELTAKGVLPPLLTRKLVHVGGIFFVFCWPLYSSGGQARFVAALPPFLNALRLLATGLGLGAGDTSRSVKSISRDGSKEELLTGPLYYLLLMTGFTVVFWRTSPVGIVALSLMCGGDGMADIIGRRFGKGNQLPINSRKSWAGSAAMFLAGAGMAFGLLSMFGALGYLQAPGWVPWRLLLVCAISTFVEALPLDSFVDDNITVPLVSMIAAIAILT